MNNLSVLKDGDAVQWLLGHEKVMINHYIAPEGVSPSKYILRLQSKISEYISEPMTYSLPSLYISSKTECCVCCMKLKVKKCVNATLFDDVLGSKMVSVITKFCTSCKLTYYPGYFEHYENRIRSYYPGWKDYPIFQSTHLTIFSIDLLKRLVCMKQKCHVSFIGKSNAFNLQHGYAEGKGEHKHMDKRRLGEGYFRYTFISFRERFNMSTVINGTIQEAMLKDYDLMYNKFQDKYACHKCDVPGCESCLVIDGNMKAHRKLCKYKGCTSDPGDKSIYCDKHSKERSVNNDEQELISVDECHIEKIVKKSMIKSKACYEVKWVGYDDHDNTMEPRENIPRILVELYERYGDSTIKSDIVNNFEVDGIKFVNVKVQNDMLSLPAESLQISENAYLVRTPGLTSCKTDKTKSRFYHRTGGVLVMAKPCGIVLSMAEIFGGESVTQVAEVIEHFLQQNESICQCVLYDDACHLKKHVDCRHVYPMLQKLILKIDRFHFQNHTDSWCRKNMDPSTCPLLDDVNTEIMEQIFAWVKGFTSSLRYMNGINFKFFLLDMLDRHNQEINRNLK